MRRSTAWLVSICALVVLGVAFVWPLAWVIRGGFLEDGHFTLRFLAGVFRNPVYVEGLIRSLRIAVGTTALVLLDRGAPRLDGQPLRVPGQDHAPGAAPGADDPAALRGGHRLPADLRGVRLVQRAPRALDGPRADRRGGAGGLLGRHRAAGAGPLPDHVPQRRGGAGQRRSGHGAGGRQPRGPRRHAVSPDHPAPDHARALRGGGHRVRVGLHRAGHAADHAVHALHARAGLRRPQGDRHQPVPLRARVRDAGGERGPLRPRPRPARRAELRDRRPRPRWPPLRCRSAAWEPCSCRWPSPPSSSRPCSRTWA